VLVVVASSSQTVVPLAPRSTPHARDKPGDEVQAEATDVVVSPWWSPGDDLMAIQVADGGHFLPEERPDVIADRVVAMRGRIRRASNRQQ
jgi:hypothetical protein